MSIQSYQVESQQDEYYLGIKSIILNSLEARILMHPLMKLPSFGPCTAKYGVMFITGADREISSRKLEYWSASDKSLVPPNADK